MVSKVGWIKVLLHRPLEGAPKTAHHPPHGDRQVVCQLLM